jgi:hypothetical protein
MIGAAIAAAAADVAALAAPVETDKTAAAPASADWLEGGRWLTPYEIPGYNGGYAVTWPGARQTAKAPHEPVPGDQPRK